MNDCISRKALFKAVEDYASTHPVMSDNELFALFCSVPAADVRPNVTGKFYLQYNGDGCWHCSECNYQARYPSNFCPNCGADMRPEEEET